ncbi:MAG: 3-mercaptopyruvate sulfurtransferase [Hyphomicrobiales bacterium]
MSDHQVTVSVDWLAEHINDDDVAVVDGTWHLPNVDRDPEAEYLEGHIPGAVFFDLEKQSDRTSHMGLMMPIAMQFGREMGDLGISESDTIIIYDTTGLFSAARVWWMFRQFSAQKVYILDGGLPAWKKAGHALETGPLKPEPKTFRAEISDDVIVGLDTMKEAVENPEGPLLLDAREAARFDGTAPEPRPEVCSGHMPGAMNLPYDSLLDDERKLLDVATLQKKFDEVGYDPDKPTIATCGSGVTACVILAALARLGNTDVPLYDGSWSEWGATVGLPVATKE